MSVLQQLYSERLTVRSSRGGSRGRGAPGAPPKIGKKYDFFA